MLTPPALLSGAAVAENAVCNSLSKVFQLHMTLALTTSVTTMLIGNWSKIFADNELELPYYADDFSVNLEHFNGCSRQV